MLQQLTDSNTAISVLVTSVGAALPGDSIALYWELSDEEEQRLQDINGASYYFFIRKLLPGMLQWGKGAIVAVSSVAAFQGAFMAQYGAEKAKLNALITSLASELHGTGVTAQAMVLGGVVTPAAAGRFLSLMSTDAESASNAAAAAELDPVAAGEARMARMWSSTIMGRIGMVASADAVGASVVRRIGWGEPVQVPYWGHALLDPRGAVWGGLFPSVLQRAVMQRIYRWVRSGEVG